MRLIHTPDLKRYMQKTRVIVRGLRVPFRSWRKHTNKNRSARRVRLQSLLRLKRWSAVYAAILVLCVVLIALPAKKQSSVSAAGGVVGRTTELITQVKQAGMRFWRSVFNPPLAGTISGKVFQDYNGNGLLDTTRTITNNGAGTIGVAVDRGIANVTVTATCVTSLGADAVIGTADDVRTTYASVTTNATGDYSISTAGAVVNSQACRVQFTNLPAGYQYAPVGTSNATATQFTADNATNVNFGILRPNQYSQDNPNIVLPCYVFGDQATGPNNAQVVLLSSPYSAGAIYSNATVANHDIPAAHTLAVLANDVGTVWGVAWARNTQRVYAASYMKKHAGFGVGQDGVINTSDDPGAVYVVNRATNTVVNTFTVPGTTTNPHNTANYLSDNFNTGWDGVGKTSLGGIALSEDESRLYVMSLQTKTLHALNPTTGAVLASQAVPTTLPLIAPSTVGTCAAGNVRPFAVRYYNGSLYVGLVCSAESSATVDTFVDGSNGGAVNSVYDFGETFTDNDGNGVGCGSLFTTENC